MITNKKHIQPKTVFGKRMLILQEEQELSQRTLAEKIGCSHQNINIWMTKYIFPNAHMLINTAKAFGVSVDWLLGLNSIRSPAHNDGKVVCCCECVHYRPERMYFTCAQCNMPVKGKDYCSHARRKE